MAEILVYSDKTPLALELATAAQSLAAGNSSEIYMLTVNNEAQAAELAAKGLQVCNVKAQALQLADTAAMGAALQKAAEHLGANLILLASNRRGKELAGRVAEALGAGCLTDVKTAQLEDSGPVFTRNALNGATVATQSIKTAQKVVAILPRSFPVWNGEGEGSMITLEMDIPATVEVLEVQAKVGDMTDIQAADRLIAIGQGVEDKEQLEAIEKIAQALNAVLACSKPIATDRKWLAEERIIGLSGKICKPDLVITLGVSGQVQFMVGIRDSKTIISINNDENADLNKMADYIFAADLNQVLPELAEALK